MRDLRFEFRVSGLGYEVSGIRFRASSFGDLAERGHGPSIVLVMARVRQNGESSSINSVISNRGRNQVSREVAEDHGERFGIRVSGIMFRVSYPRMTWFLPLKPQT